MMDASHGVIWVLVCSEPLSVLNLNIASLKVIRFSNVTMTTKLYLGARFIRGIKNQERCEVAFKQEKPYVVLLRCN
jgi:hypothetical protein